MPLPPAPFVKELKNLDYDTEKINDYYDKWAESYETDTKPSVGPKIISEFFSLVVPTRTESVIDVGCGTGRIGQLLYDEGFRTIDGFDLSSNMIKMAEKKGIYGRLTGDADLNAGLNFIEDNQYDNAIACGVFTSGHVLPECMREVIRIVRPGGLVMVSTRKSYFETSGFEDKMTGLVNEGLVSLCAMMTDAAYTLDEQAHYWGYRVL